MSLVSKLKENKYGLDDLVAMGAFVASIPTAIYNPNYIASTSKAAYFNYIVPGVKGIACGLYDTLIGIHNYYYGFSQAIYQTFSNAFAGATGAILGGLAGVTTYAGLLYGTYKTLKFVGSKLYNKIKGKIKGKKDSK